jgi:hypothetical protein
VSAPTRLRPSVAEILDCSFEDFVAPGPDAGDGGLHDDIGVHADVLELAGRTA